MNRQKIFTAKFNVTFYRYQHILLTLTWVFCYI